MSELMTKTEFIARIRQARAEWDQAISRIPVEGMADKDHPAAAGQGGTTPSGSAWSLKDILAHLTWYEREMVNMLRAHTFAGSSLWDLPLDARNAAIHEETKGLSLQQALDQSAPVYAELIGLIETLTDEDLNNPQRFPGMPLEWQPWQVIASNTYEHYEQHLPDLAG